MRFFRIVLVGASAEYNLWGQKDKPSKFDGTNMGGKQLNLAPVVGIGLGSFLLALKPQLYSTMSLNEENSSGDKVEYNSPVLPSYTVQLLYRMQGASFIGVDYSSITYKKSDSGGSESTLDSNDQITYSGWSILYGFMF
jgi:hypothetical protein